MKTMLVNGSPHPKGCTFTALLEIASILNEEDVETEVFWIGNRPVGGCIDCRKCADIFAKRYKKKWKDTRPLTIKTTFRQKSAICNVFWTMPLERKATSG